jgi:hypothetical protein
MPKDGLDRIEKILEETKVEIDKNCCKAKFFDINIKNARGWIR